MKKRSPNIGLRIALLVSVFAIITSLVVPTQQAVAKTITLKAVSFLPKNLSTCAGLKLLVDRVNERGKGELKINWLGGPEVIPAPALFDALRTGRIDMVLYAPESFVAEVPETNCLYLSQTPLEERQNGTYDWVAKFLKEKMNAHYLGRAGSGVGFHIHTNFPVAKTEDFAQKQIAARRQSFPFIKALGAIPVNVGRGDWFSAVERGIVDGYSVPTYNVVGWGMLDITKYTIDHAYYAGGSLMFLVNLDKFNALPKKHQQFLNQIAKDLEPEIFDFHRKLEDKAVVKMKQAGIKFIKLSPAEEKKFLELASSAAWEDYRKLVSPEVYTEATRLLKK